MIVIRKCEVRFLPRLDGGEGWRDGLRPSFNMNGKRVLCVVRSRGPEVMKPEVTYMVSIELPDYVPDGLCQGQTFTLQDASRVIATGTVVEI